VSAGETHVTSITAKERRKLDERIKKKYDRLRRRYPEIHGKVVELSSHDPFVRRSLRSPFRGRAGDCPP
jgi:hypothetical protein